MTEPQESGVEPHKRQRQKKTLQRRKLSWLSTAKKFL